MTNNNLNKRFFTEEDSPVPLIDTDMAWDNMHQKLEQEMPEKKKRRLFFWIPPFIGILFTVLLTGAAVIIWRGDYESPVDAIKNDSSTVTTENKHRAGLLADTITSKQLSGLHTYKAKNIQQAFSKVPILTANDQRGDKFYQKKKPKRKGYHLEKSSRPVTSVTEQEEKDGTLPFVFYQQIVVTDSISVQTDRSLPGVLFPSPLRSESARKNAFGVEGGVQWNIPVPFAGYNYYLKGTDGKDQIYRLLLPGVWLAVNKNRQRIIATVNPFVSAPMPVKDFGTGMVPVNDSMQVYAHKRMIKMFGYQAGVQYAYRITDRWWLGSGIDGNWWRKGLMLVKPVDSFSFIKPFLYTVNSKTEEKITNFQLSANIAMGYQYKDWEAVMQISTPFNKTIEGISSPVWLRLGVRWRLMNKRIQQAE